MLLEINTTGYIDTALTVIVTLVIGWIGNLMASTFKKINDIAETKAQLTSLKIEFDKHITKHAEDIKYLQTQLNDL